MRAQMAWRTMVSTALILLSAASGYSQRSITIGEFTAPPGEKKAGFINVSVGTKGPEIQIPVVIINGVDAGPVLVIAAGVQEYDNPPFYALQRLNAELVPSRLSGSVILVYTVTTPSFLRRTIYHNPLEGLNLNRPYPGKSTGRIGERITYQIASEIIERSDYLIDIHCNDDFEERIPYLYSPAKGNPFLTRNTRLLAEHFGFEVVVPTLYQPRDKTVSISLGNEAFTSGKPSLTVVFGVPGSTGEREVTRLVQGCYNIMKHLDMISGDPVFSGLTSWVSTATVIKSVRAGVFYPKARRGDRTEEGALIGEIRDRHGVAVQQVNAPHDGVIHALLDTSPVDEDVPVATVWKW